MSGWTKGPWIANFSRCDGEPLAWHIAGPVEGSLLPVCVSFPNDNYMDIETKPRGGRSIAEFEANARLIAAAPEMAELLERVRRDLIGYALDKFDWGRSALDADAIRYLNEVPLAIDALLSRLGAPND